MSRDSRAGDRTLTHLAMTRSLLRAEKCSSLYMLGNLLLCCREILDCKAEGVTHWQVPVYSEGVYLVWVKTAVHAVPSTHVPHMLRTFYQITESNK